MLTTGHVPSARSSARERPTPSPSMIERMTAVIDAFESPADRLALDDVVEFSGLPRSTAHRILVSLVQLSWLRRTPDGYALGPRTMSHGDSDHSQMQLRRIAAPVLHELQITTRAVVHLAVLQGAHVHYLDKLGGRFAASVPSRVGGRAPAHGTALGKAILAFLPPEQIDELVGFHLGRMTPRTISDLALLHQELRRVRERNGLAFERGECFASIGCVSSAVMGADGPVASISLAMPVRTPLEKVAPLVANAAKRVSVQLRPKQALGSGLEHSPVQTWSREAMDRILADSTDRWM